MTEENKGGAEAKDLLLLHLVTGNSRGCEVKWQICEGSPRAKSKKFWASPLASVQGMDALWVRAGFVRWQNSLN